MSMSSSYGYGPELQCCDAVVDPLSLLAAIGAIAALSLFLRQAVIDNMIMRRRRRKRSDLTIGQEITETLNAGRWLNCLTILSVTNRTCLWEIY